MSSAQAFALKICISLALAFWFMLWSNPHKWRELLDIYLGTALAGIIGARALYVLLNLERFVSNPLNIPRLWYGELAWQGLFIGGGLGLLAMLHWRKTGFNEISDSLAWAIPFVFIGICWAARSAGLLLGEKVADLSAHPVWMAGFLPALDRDVQARYELQMLGIGMGWGILLLVGILFWRNWLAENRFWFALGLSALAILVLDQFSAHPRQHLYGVQVDQVSAGILFLVALGNLSVKRRADTHTNPLQNGL